MADAGFLRCDTHEVEHIVATKTVDSARTAGYLDCSFTSQFTILTDQEFEQGLRRIEGAAQSYVDSWHATSTTIRPTSLRNNGLG